MHYGFIPPSSPTPHGGALRSLIPSSPSRVTLHRNRLDRASSSAGHVTAAGLTTWKRRPRKDSSDDESGKRGLGMGMKGTPGRRKKPRKTSKVRSISHSQVIPDNEQSLGIQSTPKGSSSKPPSGSGSSSSFPLSDLPDSQDTTHDTLSIFGHPEVSSPAAEAIPGFTESEESDGLTMTLISARPPSSRELHDDQQHTETLVTLFPDVQDVLIPLNDVSEPLAGSHRRRMRSEDLNALINELPHPDQVTAVMAAITHEDFTVPVNDEALSARTPVSNQPASKLIGRQSTPYVWRKKKTVLVILNDENSVADEDEIELGRGHSPQTPQARDRSESPGDEERAVTPRHDRSVLPSSDNDMAATELDEQGKYPFEPESLDDPFLNPVEEVDSRKSTRRVVPNPRDSPDIACQRYCTPGPEEATLGDPFGFDRVQQLLQGEHMRYFIREADIGQRSSQDPSSRHQNWPHPLVPRRHPLLSSRVHRLSRQSHLPKQSRILGYQQAGLRA